MNQIVSFSSPPTEHEATPLWFQRPLHRLTVEEYHRLNKDGILPSGTRVELLQGYLVTKMTQNPPHPNAICRLQLRLSPLLPEKYLIRVQAPITVKESEPEPDLSVVDGPLEKYERRHPGPRDTHMLIEVADSSLLSDQRGKGMIYAQAKIPVYWMVNLVDERIEVYTSPRGGKHPAYQERKDYGKDDVIPLRFAGQEFGQLAVKDLLP
jgi:Uma2 family endonuclease